MANDNLSDIDPQGKIALSGTNETYRSALGDGTAKPGDAVGLTSAGKVVQTDIGAGTQAENFVGFLVANRSDSTDVDTAIGDGVPCEIVVPKSGHTYAVHIVDPAETRYEGRLMGFSATAGAMDEIATLGTTGVAGVLAADVADGDDYAKVRWQ